MVKNHSPVCSISSPRRTRLGCTSPCSARNSCLKRKRASGSCPPNSLSATRLPCSRSTALGVELFEIGASVDAANLHGDAVLVEVARVAAPPVDSTDLRGGALAVHHARMLVRQLADVADQGGGIGVANVNAANAHRTIAR